MARREAPESTSDEAPFATRRALLAAGAGVATLSATVGLADTATAATSPTPRPYTATPKPTPYGELDWGSMQSMVGGFAGALDAFLRDLGPDLRQRVTVVTISEFGRRVAENGDHGLDHGWANMTLMAGGGVKGGQYYGKWPGLDTTSETNGDLTVATDYRNVFGEVLTRRFPDRSLSQVFPGLSYDPLGFMS